MGLFGPALFHQALSNMILILMLRRLFMTWDAMVFTTYIIHVAIGVGVIAASLMPILVIGCVNPLWFDKLNTSGSMDAT